MGQIGERAKSNRREGKPKNPRRRAATTEKLNDLETKQGDSL